MRLLVCGGRHFSNYLRIDHKTYTLEDHMRENKIVWKAIEDVIEPGAFIITGGAPGVDFTAYVWADVHNHPKVVYFADWEKYGKAAGHIRNKQMLDEGTPDLVLAIHGGKGTQNMIKIAEKAGIPVIKVGM